MPNYYMKSEDGYYKVEMNISKEQWKQFFNSEKYDSVSDKTKEFLKRYYIQTNECGSFSTVYDQYGDKISNSFIKILGNNALEFFNIKEFNIFDCDNDLRIISRKWPIYFWGKDLEKNHFEWKLKPEIVRAIDELDKFEKWHKDKQNESVKKYNSLKELTQNLDKKFKEEHIVETEKEAIVKARIGQGYFRDLLFARDEKCCICGIHHNSLLVASHIKAWKDSDNDERLDVNNGLLLCSIHDALFDKHLITFDDDGHIIISHRISEVDRKIMNLDSNIKIHINNDMKKYMRSHRRLFNKLNGKD